MKAWPSLPELVADLPIPPGVVLGRLRRDEVPALVRSLAAWFPDIVVGAESRHLREAFYFEQTALEGNDDPAILPMVARAAGEIVALVTFERNDDARTLTSPMGAVSPAYRGSGLGVLGYPMMERLGRAIGAELLLVYVTLKAPHEQKLAERSGFRLAGIIPGHDRDMVRPGEIRRVHEAVYAKLLGDATLVEAPAMEALTPTTRRLFELLSASPDGDSPRG